MPSFRHAATTAVSNAMHTRLSPEAVFGAISDRVAEVPARERERVRRVATLEKARLDATHPTTAARIRLLEERPAVTARLNPDEQSGRAIDTELAPRRVAIGQILLDGHRSSLYR